MPLNGIHNLIKVLYLNFTPLIITLSKSTQLNSTYLIFGAAALANLESFCAPKFAWDPSKSALDTKFVQKRFSSQFITLSNASDVFMALRQVPKQPKIGTRGLQDDLQERLFSSLFLSSILIRLGCLNEGAPRALLASRWHTKRPLALH